MKHVYFTICILIISLCITGDAQAATNIQTSVATTGTPLILSKSLYLGIRDTEVSSLQNFLKNLNYFSHPTITSYFGPITQRAVIRFQRDNSITPNGVVGPRTRKKIKELSASIKDTIYSNSKTTNQNTRIEKGSVWIGSMGSRMSASVSQSTGTSATPDTLAPSIPTSVSVTAGDATSTISWTDPTEGDFASIRIYRGTISGSSTLLTTIPKGTLTFSDIALTNGTTYYYSLASVDTSGNESSRTSEISVIPVGQFDIYVDSVSGDDSNNGTSAYDAFRTINALRTAATSHGSGVRIGLKRGSLWRESLDLRFIPNVTIEAYGTGTPPVVTGFDIKTNWIQDSTYANLWYVDITHDTGGSNRPTVLEDNRLMSRYTTISLANSNPGGYFSNDSGSANPLRVYINVGAENPNTNGKTYEVTTRNIAVYLGQTASITEIVARGAMSNNGPIETGINSTVRRCVSAYGTKHNMLMPSGLLEDCVLYESDRPSISETGVIPFVAFAENATGYTMTLRRLLVYSTNPVTDIVYSHTLNDPITSHARLTCDSCIGHLATPGTGFAGGATEYAIINSAAIGRINTPISIYAASSTISHFIGNQENDSSINSVGSTSRYHQIAINRTAVGGYPAIMIPNNGNVTVSNSTIATANNYYAPAIGWSGTSGGSLSVNRSLLKANTSMTIAPTGAYGPSNNNVFALASIGPFVSYRGTNYNLTTQMSSFRATSSQDASSVVVSTSPFLGNTANGDFRISTSTLTSAGHDGDAGVSEYWDYNLRQIVPGQPSRFPTIPTTYEQAIEYIQNPTAWNFYP